MTDYALKNLYNEIKMINKEFVKAKHMAYTNQTRTSVSSQLLNYLIDQLGE